MSRFAYGSVPVGSLTINPTLALQAAQTWTLNNTGVTTITKATGAYAVSVIDGNGSTDRGVGTVNVQGLSSYSGTMTLTNTRLIANASGGANSAFVVNDRSQFYANSAVAFSRPLTITGDGWVESDGSQNGALRLANGATYSGNITLAGNAEIGVDNGRASANVINGSGGLTVASASGTGTLMITGVSTYTGTTTILSGAALQLGNGGTLGTISNGSAIVNNGKLIVNKSNNFAITQKISGAGTLTKQGLGTLILTNSNSFTGVTVVSQGVLQANGQGSLGNTSAITVDSGAQLTLVPTGNAINDSAALNLNGGTLAFTGTFSGSEKIGALSIGSNAIIDFGSKVGNTLIFDSLALNGKKLSIYNYSGGPFLHVDNGSDLLHDRLLFVNDTGIAGATVDVLFYSDNGQTLIDSTSSQIQFTGSGPATVELLPTNLIAVPEPSNAIAALLVGISSLGFGRMRVRAFLSKENA